MDISSTLKIGRRLVRVSNLERVLWPETGLTKYDLISYLIFIAPFMLPHLRNRPLVLRRFPEGIGKKGFYQKNCPPGAPRWIETFRVLHRGDRITDYIIADNVETLVWIGNQAAIEIHPWLSERGRLDSPDFAVFDLDPMERSTFNDVLEVARILHECLADYQIRGYPKTSGATGVQVFVPIYPLYPYDTVRNFVMDVCKQINRACPEKTTLERKIEKREGKIYLDYLQNVQGKTLVSPYSPRPLPGAPVSMPLSWDEIKAGRVLPGDFTISDCFRTARERAEYFAGSLTDRQFLPRTS
ncbi:MAG: DNA polymerase domain-containing protein [Firmicutes bacterium]|nr:DNA polymerase domain-containing protein [Bacillota bacterium]